MARAWRVGLVVALAFVLMAGPALAADGGSPAVDINDFLPGDFGDTDGDGVPELFDDINGDGIPDIPPGIHGIWDDVVGAQTPEEFLEEVDFAGVVFDTIDPGSSLVGPCGGLAISYDADGLSLDSAVDAATDEPPIDVLTGDQAFTKNNPFRVDSRGIVVYYGFTREVPTLSLAGSQPGVDYGDDARAFHDHRWEMVVLDVSADDGGDPNQNDHNRNAARVELSDILPFKFRALVKAKGGIVDLHGPTQLPSLTADNVASIAGGAAYCFGEGWVEFVGEGLPFFDVPGAVALILAALGFSGVVFNARPVKSWRA